MIFSECIICGATLDPGEKCDCEKENGLPDGHRNSPKQDAKSHTNSVAQSSKKIKENPLRNLRISKNLSAWEIVNTVRPLYPKFDKTLLSKCEHGEKYGIDPKPQVLDALYEKYDKDALKKERYRRGDYHRLECRVQCRMTSVTRDKLLRLFRKYGYYTTQDGMTALIQAFLNSEIIIKTN